MNIVGIDVGETCGIFGVNYAKSVGINDYYYKQITTDDRGPLFVFSLAKEVENFLEEVEPDFAVLEGYAFGGGRFFNFQQPEIQAQIKRFLADSGIPFYEPHISAMRKAVIGKGNAKKADAKKFMLDKFPLLGNKLATHIYDAGIPAYMMVMFFNGDLTEEMSDIVRESIVGGSYAGSLCG